MIHWRRRGRARWLLLAAPAIAAVVLATLPSTGLGSGAGVAQAPGVAHGKPVAPKVFRGDVRDLHEPSRAKKKALERPEEPKGGFTKPQPTGQSAPVEAPAVTILTPSVSFKGLDHNTWGAGWPPDTVGDVGPNHFIQAVNTSIGIYSKAGTQLAAFTFDSLWSGTGTACDSSNDGDPTVIYDPLGDRWIVADLAFVSASTGPYYECIAVSRTSDPVAGGWYLYAVRADDASHPWLPDYPKMGIWPDGLYMTANMFQGAAVFREVRVWAFNRADLESGATLRSVVADLNTTTYFSLLPSNMRGTAPPAGRENLLVSESQTAFAYQVFKFHVDYSGSGSTFTGPTNVSQTSYTVAATTVPSPANSLDSLRERLMMQAQYRNIGGTESLWVNHTVKTAVNGVTGIQWAQINVTGGTVSTTPEQQQIYGNVGGDGLHRWMGSLAVDKDGNMALGYSVSSGSVAPDIRYAGRLAGDTLGTLPQGETTMLSGVARGTQSGNCGGSVCTRWGDYSAMTIDPDGCTFWYTNEYYEATGLNWQTRIGSFKFAQCTPIDTTPPTALDETASTNQGVAVPITLQGSDPDSCELAFSIVSGPANGTLGSISNNTCSPGTPDADSATVTYTPNAGFHGLDSFTYKVNDGTSDSNVASVAITVNATATSYDQAVLADSPAVYWRLGESSVSSAADSSGNGNGGSYSGGVSLGQAPLINDPNTAAGFDGNDDRVYFSDSATLSPTVAISMEAWIRPNAVPTAAGSGWNLVSKWNTALLYINGAASPKFVFTLYDSGTSSYGPYLASTTTVAAATTYHVVGTYDGTTMRIYVNGVLEGSIARSGPVNDSSLGGALAGGGWGTLPSPAFQGRLDETAIYPTALNSTRVQTHYLTGAPATYASTVLADSPAVYWRLGESSGSSAADSSGNGNGGSYSGGVTLGQSALINDPNTAASFDGNDDRMYFTDSASLSPTAAISLEAWIRPNTVPSNAGSGWNLVSKWNTALLYIQGGASPKFIFTLYNGGTSSYGPYLASTTTVAAATTYHVVGTYDGTTMRIYVNGTLEASIARSGPVNDSTAGGALAGGGWGTVPSPAFQGRLDEIAIYGSALSNGKVQAHYTKGIAP